MTYEEAVKAKPLRQLTGTGLYKSESVIISIRAKV